MAPKLSIIISNRNDLTMLAITLRSCLEELKAVAGGGEVVICDNSSKGYRDLLPNVLPKKYIQDGLVKLIYQDFPCLFTAREAAIRAAVGDYIFCVDSHVLIGHDTLRDLVDFMNRNKANEHLGFAHAPLTWAHQHESMARHDRDISISELGPWGAAYKYEQKITWKGMPWICRRTWFTETLGGYGALSQHRLAWGGGDLHIGTKPWLLGYENWAVPCNPVIHLGPWPGLERVHQYRVYNKSGEGTPCLGFLVSCYILGGEPMMERNADALVKRFSWIKPRELWTQAKELGREEKLWLDERRVLTYEQMMKTKPWDCYPGNSVRRCPADKF